MCFLHKCDNALKLNAGKPHNFLERKCNFLTNDLTRNNCPNSFNRLHCQDKYYSKPVKDINSLNSSFFLCKHLV